MKYDWLENYEDGTVEPMEMGAEESRRVLSDALGKVERVQKTAECCKKAGKRRLIRWTAAMAAVLAAGILTAGAAAGTFDSGEMLHWIFGAGNPPELLDGLGVMGSPIGQSQEQDGYTVNLYGAVGDWHSCCLVFDVTAPEGNSLDHPGGYGFQSVELRQAEYSGGAFGYYCTELEDDDPTDNVARFMVAYDQEKSLEGKCYTLCLKGFTKYGDDPSGDGGFDHEKVLADGVWEFSFRIGDLDTSVSVPVRQETYFRGEPAGLSRVTVSPFSIRLEYRSSQIARFFSRDAGPASPEDVREEAPRIILTFTDGTECCPAWNMSGVSSNTNILGVKETCVTYHFQELLNPARLDSIEIDGVRFDLP